MCVSEASSLAALPNQNQVNYQEDNFKPKLSWRPVQSQEDNKNVTGGHTTNTTIEGIGQQVPLWSFFSPPKRWVR